ncbi:unnamed protein product [Phytomonas sp. EM1]|nr:unnamed protein product [Phytomonas sp. EM1]|eukprot:CCW64108.1 unnamed protein product [Phytomonas sp. isolate EM1]
MEQVPGTAIEQYFNQLIQMGLVSQLVLSDRQGNTILSCFGLTPAAPTKTEGIPKRGSLNNMMSSAMPNPPPTYGGARNRKDVPVEASEEDVTNTAAEEDMPMESNVVLSGARCFQNLEQLQLGVPLYVSAQYHDAVVVQALDKSCFLTLIGYRSQGHCVGGLLVLIPQIQKSTVYHEIIAKVEKCFQ